VVACASEHYEAANCYALSYSTVCQVPCGTFIRRRRTMMMKFWPLSRVGLTHTAGWVVILKQKIPWNIREKKQLRGECSVPRHVKSHVTKDDTCVLHLIPLLADWHRGYSSWYIKSRIVVISIQGWKKYWNLLLTFTVILNKHGVTIFGRFSCPRIWWIL
jgi:hypothetical protein